MKILILNPGSKVTKNVVRDVLYGCWCKGKRIGGGTVPPFALLSVATFLKHNGKEVKFLDAAAEQLSLREQYALAADFNIVIISTSTMSFSEDLSLLKGMKEINPSLKTVLFGSHPTFMPEDSLKDDTVDFISRGEPEKCVNELMDALIKNLDYGNIKGLGFKKDGIILNDISYIEDLNKLPPLDTDMLPENIHYFNPLVKFMPYITATVSRGCPGKCTFCTAPFFYGPKIRFKDDEKVIEEMRHYKNKGYKEVYFRDETFIIKGKRDKEFCEKLISADLNLSWLCNCRIGMVDYEDLTLMKKAGCHLIKFGVESGVQEILNNVKKGIKLEQTRETFKWTKEIGIDTHAHVMLGMPGETESTIKQTIDFILEIDPTTATFGICSPYPGSPLFSEVLEKAPAIKDGTDMNLLNLHTQALYNKYYTELENKEIEKYVTKAYRKFYLRPKFFFKTLRRIKSFNDLKRFSIAGTKIIDFALRGE